VAAPSELAAPVQPAPVQTRPADMPPAEAPNVAPPPEGQQGTGPNMVQTEIGELPSDLWTILGERPPSSGPSSPAATQRELSTLDTLPAGPAVAQMPAPAAAPARAFRPDMAPTQVVTAAPSVVRRALDTQTGAPAMNRMVTQAFAPPVIQRAQEEVPTRGETGDIAADTEQEEESGTEAGIDVDKLAALVFPEIKRRLAIEWERGRGRIR